MSYGYQPQQPYPPAKHQSSSSKTMWIVLGLVFGGLALAGVCFIGLILVFLPAVQAAREAAAKAASANNLKQIGMGLHNYHDIYKTFPPAFIPDADGNPRTSWRTCLLPFVEHRSLYDENDFHVAWDDPVNASVRQTPVPVYRNPLDLPKDSNLTSYAVIVGQQTPWRPTQNAQGARLQDFKDGTANTIMVVEIKNSDIEWAEPRDLNFDSLATDPNRPNAVDLGGGAVVLFGDGSTRILPRDTDLATLRAMLTSDGGESVTPP